MGTAGYSGTPLAKKLGIKPGFNVQFINQPDGYFDLFTDLPPDINKTNDHKVKKDVIHFFTKSESELREKLNQLKKEIKPNGMIWVSWPKKTSNVDTDLNGNIVRHTGLSIGLVDIKVCAIDNTWSALKFVIRVKDRKKHVSGKT